MNLDDASHEELIQLLRAYKELVIYTEREMVRRTREGKGELKAAGIMRRVQDEQLINDIPEWARW